MGIIDVIQPVDKNGNVLSDPSWPPLRCEKLVTFAGGTTDAWGDDGGALDGGAIFTVTGTVRVRIFGVVETDLVGAATLEGGVADDTDGLLGQVADTSGMDENEIWHDSDVDAPIEASTVAGEKIIGNGQDIILTVTTANITAGAIRFFVSWYPISKDGDVIPSSN